MKFMGTVHGPTVHRRRSKVAAIVHVPYMNSAACWGKGVKKKKKKKNAGNLKHSKRNVDPNSAINLKFTVLCSGAKTLSSLSLGFLGAMEPEITTLGSSIPVPCVQELAKETRSTVPPRYVRFPNEPPIISDTTSLPQVPVIDMQRLFSAEFKDTELEKLHYASKEWGFFQVILSLSLSLSLSL